MTRNIKISIGYIIIIAVLGFTGIQIYKQNYVTKTVSSNIDLPITAVIRSSKGIDIQVRVANSEKTRELGLSHFKNIPSNQGMLFVFPQMGIYPFWMKNMNFPIDILWIDKNNNIVDRVINIDPSSYPKTFIPKENALYVLEIPAYTADDYGFLVGSSVIIKK